MRLWLALPLLAGMLCLAAAPAGAEINYTLSYQGYLTDSEGAVINGSRAMVFTIYDAASGGTALWTQSKTVTVTAGVFSVVLGETNSITLDKENDYWLGINVAGDGEMDPRIRLTAGMFSLLPNLGERTVLVAKSNGDYDTITKALAAITDAATDNRYLIKVGPGVFEEKITMKAWVKIQGSGQGVTIIKGDGYDLSTDYIGVVAGAENSALSNLTVEDDAASAHNTTTGIYNQGASPNIQDVTVMAHGATTSNYGIRNDDGASPTIQRTSVDAYGGGLAVGIYNYNASNPEMVQVEAQGRDASGDNYGIFSYLNCALNVKGSTFTASGASAATSTAMDEQSGVGSTYEKTTFSASGGNTTIGISVSNTAQADLRGCRVTAQDASTTNTAMSVYTSSTDTEVRLTKCQFMASASNITANLVGISAAGSASPDYTVTLTMDTVKTMADGGVTAKGLTTYLARVVGMSVWAAALNAEDSCVAVGVQDGELTLVNSVVQSDGGASPPTGLGLNGLYVNNTRTQVMNSSIVAANKGASNSGYGVNQQGTDTDKQLELINCQVSGETVGVIANSASDFNAGATQMSGSFNSVGTGTSTCVNCFTGGMAAMNSDCTTTP